MKIQSVSREVYPPLFLTEHRFLWDRMIEAWMKEVGKETTFLLHLWLQLPTFEKLGVTCDWFEAERLDGIRLVGVCFHLPLDGHRAFLYQAVPRLNQSTSCSYQPISVERFAFQQKREASRAHRNLSLEI